MNDEAEARLEVLMQPIAEAMKDSFVKAMLLRVQVHERLAINNGAEAEDIPQVIIEAIESASPITKRFLDEIGQIEKAHQFGAST